MKRKNHFSRFALPKVLKRIGMTAEECFDRGWIRAGYSVICKHFRNT